MTPFPLRTPLILFIFITTSLFLCLLFLPTINSKSDRAKTIAAKIAPRLKAELTKKNLTFGSPIYIRIFKESDELELWIQGQDAKKEYVLFRNYKICSWSGKLGPKLKEGDHQSPEGCYRVGRRQMNPRSRYHLSFDLGFPNALDRSHQRTGSFLMVHGNCASIGCYAMGDDNIEEIYTLAAAALHKGQNKISVHCFPFRMIKARMLEDDVINNQWQPFWQDLQKIYRSFERTWIPPIIKVQNGHYLIEGNP